jgi:DNA-binding response OmpR family regulator
MANILLVGSDPSINDMYLKVLDANGFDSTMEITAKDGLDRLTDHFFPAAIVFLPREETLWFLIKLRSSRSVQVSSIPVLVVADEASENLIEYIESGATKVISKFPTSGDKIVTELRNILNIPRMKP